MSDKAKALIAVLIVAVLGGANSPYVKLAVSSIPPFSYTFIRFFFSFLIILPIFLSTKPKLEKDNLRLIWFSLFSTFNIILFAFGIKMTTAATGQVIQSFSPVVVVIISFYLLKEKLTFKKVLGIIIGFIGANLVISLPLFNHGLTKQAVIGNLLIFVGVISFSYYNVLSKNFLKKYSPLWLTVAFIFTTMLVSLLFSFREVSLIKYWGSNLSLTLVWALFYVVLIGTVTVYFLQQYAILYGSPLIASLILYLAPGTTMIWSNIILGEGFSLILIVGTIITLFGAWLVTRES